MTKILDVNNICDAIIISGMPEGRETISVLENAVSIAAGRLAEYLRIKSGPADYQGGFGGLCVNFEPAEIGQTCPDVIDEGDPDGEWE